MVQVCPNCKTAYHWEVPRFSCACGRFDPSLAAPAESLIPQREQRRWDAVPQRARNFPGPAPSSNDTLRRDPTENRGRPALGPRATGLTPKSRPARRLERYNADDDQDDLPWQHRSRDLR